MSVRRRGEQTSTNGAVDMMDGEVPSTAPRRSILQDLAASEHRPRRSNHGGFDRIELSEEEKLTIQKYEGYPLIQSLLRYERVRRTSFRDDGKAQMQYPLSTEGWIATLLVIRGRALGTVVLPWTFVVLHAVGYTLFMEFLFGYDASNTSIWSSWDIFLGLALSSTLAFLLVFRLQRGADRFWTSRRLWGLLVAKVRTAIGGITVHGTGEQRDHAVRWLVAFTISTMEHLRGEKKLDGDMFAGILTEEEVQSLEASIHPPLHCVHKIRFHLRELFRGGNESALELSRDIFSSQILGSLENQLNEAMDCCGGAERIKGTPLPLVYVSHLRTILIMYLLIIPYVHGGLWEWSTAPLVALTAFVWLGIEAAAVEVEAPFGKESTNALNMDGYCLNVISTTLQELLLQADHELDIQC